MTRVPCGAWSLYAAAMPRGHLAAPCDWLLPTLLNNPFTTLPMKPSIILALAMVLLITTLALCVVNAVYIRKTYSMLAHTNAKLANTYKVMDKVAEQQAVEAALDEVKITPGTLAVDFSLENTRGEQVSLGSFGKKDKLLVFSSASCQNCQNFYPALDQYAKSQSQIAVVVLQIDASAAENQRKVAKEGYHFDLLVANEKLFEDYLITGTPTSVLVDKQGKVVKTGDLFDYNDILAFVQ